MNYINESTSEIKSLARHYMKGIWVKTYLCFIIFVIFAEFIPQVTDAILGWDNDISEDLHFTFGSVQSMYEVIFGGVFILGFYALLLSAIRHKNVRPTMIFSGFDYFLKALTLTIVQSVLIFLWTLLLVIPGIIAIYRYSMSYFILADNPNKSVMQCIEESKRMMIGNKAKLLVLQISFIGWVILAAIPFGIVLAYLSFDIPEPKYDILLMQHVTIQQSMTYIYDNYIYVIILFALSLVTIFPVRLYMETSKAVFYELISGNLKRQDYVPSEGYHQNYEKFENATEDENEDVNSQRDDE